jgi:hypothetical protein
MYLWVSEVVMKAWRMENVVVLLRVGKTGMRSATRTGVAEARIHCFPGLPLASPVSKTSNIHQLFSALLPSCTVAYESTRIKNRSLRLLSFQLY